MLGFIGKLVETTVDVVTLPVALAADVVTMGGALNDRARPYTVDKAGRIIKNAVDAVEMLAK
ncbi:hypothetical protein [Mycoplana dimorpha]|uniref:Uncharacterized protein n=1 Tax=Mycoplana dimorpha TaxID=28320 RepID=A0A2T5AIV1_MYCDI|nr:hypothetical protein [Mycoplana dimorpha]PTM86661.1 hypothetical protein C7449_1165 [Mycoplana dimorpha]